MKRVGYGRVSTAGQARNGTSLAEQKKQLMADEELLRDVVRRQMAGEISAAAAASELGMSRRTYYNKRAAWCMANAVYPQRR